MLNELILFTGAGGGLLGTKLLGWRAIGYVEKEEYCQRVIAQRIADGIVDEAPIFGDIRIFNNEWVRSYQGLVDVITAGFPCQPFSVAGKQIGEADERNMWPETIKSIRLVRPRFCLLENVPGLLASGYFGTILGDLAESGYDCRWRILSAAEVGAPHLRKRLWIVANAQCNGSQRIGQDGRTEGQTGLCRGTWWDQDPADLPDSNGEGLEKREGESRKAIQRTDSEDREGTQNGPTQSFVGRVAHGVAHRVDRLKAIGNGQVPGVVRAAWELLNG